MSEITKTDLVERIERLVAEAKKHTVAAVNTAMVYTYYEIGRMIVEDEQQGEQRAEYGTEMLKNIARQLTQKFGKGFSYTNLEQMRKFYKVYSQIPQTLSEKSENENSATLSRNSSLPLTNYQKGQTSSGQLHFTLSWVKKHRDLL